MMLKPSIDKLLGKINSKYSLVILASKRAHELDEGAQPTIEEFKSVKTTQQALEEIEQGSVIIHPNPQAKREKIRLAKEAEKAEKERNKEAMRAQIESEHGKMM
jgi:DNA-directed RNA polymerase subunit omega